MIHASYLALAASLASTMPAPASDILALRRGIYVMKIVPCDRRTNAVESF